MIENQDIIIETMDIEYGIVPFDETEMEKKGYRKLPKEIFEKANMIFQYIPGEIAQKASEKMISDLTKNAYKVILKDGQHLAKSKSKVKDSAYRGLIYNKNNNLIEHANLEPIIFNGSFALQASQLALGVFNAMSIVTGQYFLSEINGKTSQYREGFVRNNGIP